MALIKEVVQPTGFVTNYINIKEVRRLQFEGRSASVRELIVGMYKDEESRQNNAAPVPVEVRLFLDETKACLLKKILYEALKQSSYTQAADHLKEDDPDLTPLVTFLQDSELRWLHARIEYEMQQREVVAMDDAKKTEYFAALDSEQEEEELP